MERMTRHGGAPGRPQASGDGTSVVAAANRPPTDHALARVPVVLLAAGAGTRMGDGPHKLLRTVDGRPLVDHALERAAPFLPPHRRDRSRFTPELADRAHAHSTGGRRARCPAGNGRSRCTRPCSTSTRLHPGVLIALADDPLALDDLPRVLDAVRADPTRPVLIRHRAASPHPVWAPRAAADRPPNRRTPSAGWVRSCGRWGRHSCRRAARASTSTRPTTSRASSPA